jgi:exosortase/archaeosortase family protein
LRTPWKKWLLCIAIIPIGLLRNGLRIMALSTLAVYVNPAFLYGNLHKHGGVVFFILGLIPFGLLLMWLQKSEKIRPAETMAVDGNFKGKALQEHES